ncbi:hypothetical protein ASG65_26685 [Bacillus sp. Leaf13]|nr:hypothetical protein ASG65_26685 [Bacillus sp. Leaf13]
MKEEIVQLTKMLNVSNHGHILYIFDDIHKYIENMVSYIESGIELGQHIIIIDSQPKFELINHKLQESLTHVELQSIHYVDNYEFYRLNRDFHCNSIINHFAKILKPLQDQQFSIRTWAHVEWKEHDNIIPKLINFENVADETVKSSEVISVCAYNGKKISASLQNHMLRNHEYFMTDTELVKSNLYKKKTSIFPSLSKQIGHKKITGQLKVTKHQLNSFIMHNLDPILIFGLDDKVIKVNHSFERTFGFSASEVLGLSAFDVPIIPDDRTFEVTRNRSYVMVGENIDEYESIRKTKDGKILNVMMSCFPLWEEENKVNGMAVIYKDFTERKHSQELLIKAEKLSIAGELAASIAHEIRNPLTTIKGFLQLVLPEIEEKKYYYDIMASEIDRIEEILSELLILAKPQVVYFQEKKISLLIKEVVALMIPQANMNNVLIKTEFDSEEVVVKCEYNSLKQAFINFMKNSIEAMPKGGELVIQMENINKDGILIRFIDQGCGIPNHILSKVGQPFYTTKEKGTGLGFMVSKKIIENHKGSISISSQENKGTSIEVKLPF